MKNIEKIDSFHFDDIKNEIHPSVFFQNEEYDLFILRIPHTSKTNKLEYYSLAFIITDNMYYYYNKNNKEFISLENSIGFYKFIDNYVDNTLKTVNLYWSEIELIEDNIYEGRAIKDFNKQWYIYKTDLIRINRVLNKAIETLTLLMKVYKKRRRLFRKKL